MSEKTTFKWRRVLQGLQWAFILILLAKSFWDLPEAMRAHAARPYSDILFWLTLIFSLLSSAFPFPKKFDWIGWIVSIAWLIFLAVYFKPPLRVFALGLAGILVMMIVFRWLGDWKVRGSGLLPAASQATMADVEFLLRAGERIYAIRCYREIHRCGLAEAKKAVDESHIGK